MKKKERNERILILYIVLALFAIIFNSYIPYCDYILILANYVVFLFSCRKLNATALITSIVIIGILLIGLTVSQFTEFKNFNFMLIIGIPLNCILFMSIAKGRSIFVADEQINAFFKFLVSVGNVSCIYNIAINLNEMLSMQITSYTYGINFASFYGGRNAFAILLNCYLFASMYMYEKTQRRKYLYSGCFMLLNLFLTFSRASILMAAAFIGIYVILRSKKSVKKTGQLIVLLIFAIGVISWGLSNYYDWLNHFLLRKEFGSSYRLEYWNIALDAWCQSPLFGWGPAIADQLLLQMGSAAGSSMHNTCLEILTWGGLALLIVYGMRYVEIVQSIKLIKHKNKTLSDLYTGFIIGLLIYMCFESSMLFALSGRLSILTIFTYVLPIQLSKYYHER